MHVPLSIKTFPRYFKEAGYTTGLIGKWHIGKEPGPAEHGFDHVYYNGDGKNTEPSETEGGKDDFMLIWIPVDLILSSPMSRSGRVSANGGRAWMRSNE